MKEKNTSRKGLGLQSIQLEKEIALPLKEFGAKCRMSGAEVARVILAFGLPRLLNGDLIIVNGELTTASRKAA